ncbi:MAG: nickel-responsive transcriptional regulator NikR [Burkholderiaceae bacterium]
MQRFTISLDDPLADQFDAWIARRAYDNRSEAVRDLIRERLNRDGNVDDAPQGWCVATLSFVYDHHDHTVANRILDLQHRHHDLVVSSLHTHLDHDHCLEVAVFKGRTAAVAACCQELAALRGVRHGQASIVPLQEDGQPHRHEGAGHADGVRHRHLKPVR